MLVIQSYCSLRVEAVREVLPSYWLLHQSHHTKLGSLTQPEARLGLATHALSILLKAGGGL